MGSLSHASSQYSVGVDLVSFAFSGPVDFDKQKPLYIDAADRTQNLNAIQLRVLVRKLVAGFKTAGIPKGGRVLVHLFNSVIYSPIFFAIVGAGGVFIGSNPAYRFFELDQLCKLVEPTLIVTSSDLLPTILKVANAGGISANNIYCLNIASFNLLGYSVSSEMSLEVSSLNKLDTDDTAARSFEELLAHGEHDWIKIFDEATAKTTVAALFLTTGTTGLPKAAMFSHNALVNLQESFTPNVPYEIIRSLSMPYFHMFGFLFGHVFPIRYGQPLYLSRRFNTEEFIRVIHEHNVTDTFMSPQMLSAVNASNLPLKERLQSLRNVLCGGENMHIQTQLEFCSHLSPGAVVNQAWGTTETGCATRFQWPEQDTTGSVGRVARGAQVKLIDQKGNLVTTDGTVGEAYVRTEAMMSGYWKNLSLSTIDQHGWFATGDILSVKGGKYYVQGRAKELIKVKGWQVSPAEIEAVLRKHEHIADAAVIGVRRKDGLSEVPKAFVVRKSDLEAQSLGTYEVYNFARDRLASFKALDGGVLFVEKIPRSPIGKIQRYKLKEMEGLCSSNADVEPATKRGAVAEEEHASIDLWWPVSVCFAVGFILTVGMVRNKALNVVSYVVI